MSSGTHGKRDREKAKKERAEIKRERRDLRRSDAATADDAVATRPQEEVLAALAALHSALHDEQISFDDFESAKATLIAQLSI